MLKCGFNLFRLPFLKRMKHLILIIFFKLQVGLLEAFEVMIERQKFVKVTKLVSLNLFGNLFVTLLEVLQLNVGNSKASFTGSFCELVLQIFKLLCVLLMIQIHCILKLFNLLLHLKTYSLERLWGTCKLLNNFFYICAKCLFKVTWNFTSYFFYGFL